MNDDKATNHNEGVPSLILRDQCHADHTRFLKKILKTTPYVLSSHNIDYLINFQGLYDIDLILHTNESRAEALRKVHSNTVQLLAELAKHSVPMVTKPVIEMMLQIHLEHQQFMREVFPQLTIFQRVKRFLMVTYRRW